MAPENLEYKFHVKFARVPNRPGSEQLAPLEAPVRNVC